MSESFSSYPVLDSSHYIAIGYVSEKPEFSYTENFEEFPLTFDVSSENLANCSGKITDPRCSWDAETHDLKVSKVCRITSAYCLFGERGVAPSDATLGLALSWISTESDERGIVPFGEITKSDSSATYCASCRFDRGKLRGSLKIQIIVYLKDPGHPQKSEMYFAQQIGTVLGVLDQVEVFIDGNGSVFPIVVIDAPGEPLWHVYFNDLSDPMQDQFGSENVEIRLNKAHPCFDLLKIETSMKESPLFLEVLSSALMVIVASAKECLGHDWNNVLNGEGFASGSIAEAMYYFISKLEWDVSSPAKLSNSIKKFLENGN